MVAYKIFHYHIFQVGAVSAVWDPYYNSHIQQLERCNVMQPNGFITTIVDLVQSGHVKAIS